MTPDQTAAATLCVAVAGRLDAAGYEELAAHIRGELSTCSNVPETEHRRTLRDFTRLVLENIALGQGPVAEHLQFARRASQRRAHLGVSANDVLRSFHIGNRALWAALQEAPEATDQALIALVEPLAMWTEAVAATVVDAFVDEAPTQQARESRIRQQFFTELGDPDRLEQVADHARALGLDVSGNFQAVCSPRSWWPDTEIESLQRATRRLPGVIACGVRGTVMVALIQDSDRETVLRTARSISGPDSPFGTGLTRRGLGTAHICVTDAERALRVAQVQNERTVAFEDGWLEGSILDSRTQLAPLLEPVQQVRHDYPDLGAAVQAYADAGFSLARAATELNMHPNSVAYRLARWHELTGADPRTFPGLVRSIVGIRSMPNP